MRHGMDVSYAAPSQYWFSCKETAVDNSNYITSNVIQVEDLRKTYKDFVAVDSVSFGVLAGEIFGLLGPNGAGKTTIVECLQGLRQPTSGKLRVLGLDPTKNSVALRRRIGSQLQDSELPQRIKVWEALDLFSSVNIGRNGWKKLLEQWDLAEKANASFSSLSGGQRQRLFIALALINHPEVVFLDEMTTGLDPVARHVAWDLIREIQSNGTTVVMVTHFMDEAEALCDRLAIVDGGKIVALDSPSGLTKKSAVSIKTTFSYSGHDLSWLRDMDEVKNVTRKGTTVEVEGTGAIASLVAAALVNRGIVPDDLRIKQPSLEDVFLTITGRRIGV
jgi:ABC-2 type transport system ATP-binding protein